MKAYLMVLVAGLCLFAVAGLAGYAFEAGYRRGMQDGAEGNHANWIMACLTNQKVKLAEGLIVACSEVKKPSR